VTDSKDNDRDPKSEVVGFLADGERFWQAFTPKTVANAAQPRKKNRRPINFNRDSGMCYVRANVKYIAPINEDYVSDVN
jgi:hypothetical protein